MFKTHFYIKHKICGIIASERTPVATGLFLPPRDFASASSF